MNTFRTITAVDPGKVTSNGPNGCVSHPMVHWQAYEHQSRVIIYRGWLCSLTNVLMPRRADVLAMICGHQPDNMTGGSSLIH